ncbi:glycosyltransferase 1 domain-containing protein 1-like isoform X1 [Pomacea canaliculata]|uniref:glycosyltransferase 1 domain-containing protein 1-like isoform X1 n=1 Tax=Pomacea canaliculata TaxID=400727 RepID=UPI000D73B17C|nr:glycosyltransferase 1 domain-containing protein 1-like isoform X1 [Pomacea canaliculata]
MAVEAVEHLVGLGPFCERMPSALLLLSPCRLKGGNFGTIFRIRSHLEKHGYNCHLWDPQNVEKCGGINVLLNQYKIDLVLGIHAYHAGRFMKDSNVPYILILGGTDVNEFSKEEKYQKVMTAAIYKARYVVAFSESLQSRALSLWPQLSLGNLTVIRQAVTTNPSNFCLSAHLLEHHGIVRADENHIFLFVGAIRPVKNPLFLMDEISKWHEENSRIFLVIIGHVADDSYFRNDFEPALNRCKGVVHIPGLSTACAHASMQQVFALVNSSQSEGMSLAILEAMKMKLPVLARDIPGNSSIIQDGRNGLLFSTPEEFREKASALMQNPLQRQHLVTQAEEFIASHHNIEQEDAAYQKLIVSCQFPTGPAVNGYS